MRNEKGQALVEFVLILPITLILIFCVVDFGRVISLKNDLENKTSDIVMLYQNGKTLDEIDSIINKEQNGIKIDASYNEDYITISVTKKIKPITPGLSYIKKELFDVSTSRVIKNE